jgi:hypothetical protein
MRPLLPLATALALAGCSPSVTFSYAVPARYTLPDPVRTVAVVDLVESPASDAAADTMVEVLTDSPRLKVVTSATARTALGNVSVTRGEPIPVATVKDLAGKAGVTGVLALDRVEIKEDLTYESKVESTTHVEKERPAGCASCATVDKEVTEDKPVTVAHRTSTVTTGWQIYAADGSLITSWAVTGTADSDGKGADESAARANTESADDLAKEAAEAAAFEAAKEISPYTAKATRRYFRGGSAVIREGAKHAADHDWAAAADAWRKASKDDDDKVRGRALLDLAVAAEKAGDIPTAAKQAAEAAKLLDDKWVDEYARALKTRGRQAKRLDDQLGAPETEGAGVKKLP